MMKSSDYQLLVRIAPEDIDLFNKIIEAYDNLCLVTALDSARGELLLRLTPDTRPDLLKILKHLPFSVEICEPAE